MTTTCDIDFENNPEQVVFSGQVLRGTVRLKLVNFNHIRNIFIQFHGAAYTEWTDISGKLNARQENYLDRKIYLVESDDDEGELITSGAHNYPFEITLPRHCPTSVEGEYGYIRYTVRVVINFAQRRAPLRFEEPFTVIKPRDLNLQPSLRESVVVRKVLYLQIFPFFCFSSSPLRLAARSPVGGYVPGQTINLKISVTNQSDVPVSMINLKMFKELSYFANMNQKKDIILLKELDTIGVPFLENKIVFANILVPSTPPTDFASDNIVSVRYFIRVTAEISHCFHTSPELDVPIIIGTYPLENGPEAATSSELNDADGQNSTSPLLNRVIFDQPSAPQMPSSDSPSAPPPYPDDDPPTYEEAMMSNSNGKKFKPKYPIYRRQTSYSIGE